MINLVLFGPPGAGKGTQSEKIIEKYDLIHISTGNLFRMHMAVGSDLGNKAQQYIDAGKLVPDDIVVGMVESKVTESKASNGFIFDGFPRTVNQAVELDKMLLSHDLSISGMISLDVPEDELISRIKERAKTSGRVDDQDENKIQTRIAVYKNETLPVAEYYNKQGKYYSVNGVGSIDEIFASIKEKISSFSD